MSDPLLNPPAMAAIGAGALVEDPELWEKVRTKPIEPEFAGKHYYFWNDIKHASIIAKDGTRLGFKNQIHKTNIIPHIKFLMNEISLGHPNIKMATEAQVNSHEMNENPQNFYSAQMKPQVEQEVRTQLEAELRAQIEAEYAQKYASLTPSDAEKLAGSQSNTGKSVNLGGTILTPVSTADISGAASGSASGLTTDGAGTK